uniref:Uncharacterized protein n=1 Tax=Oryza punctata TaxID=4537 RepID=A0A0E0K862_ORYPU
MDFAVIPFRQVASLKYHSHARATRCFAHPEAALSEKGDCSGGGRDWDCGGGGDDGWNGDADEIDLGLRREQEPTHLDPFSLTLDPLCLPDLKNDPRAHWSQHS